MFQRLTAEVRQVLTLVPPHAAAAGRTEMAPADLAAALAAYPVGNTAGIWTSPLTGPRATSGGPKTPLKFDEPARAILTQALTIAVAETAAHVGTEHLLAALVRGGPPDVVTALAARGATPEAVDALLARLAGGPGIEGLAEEPRLAEGLGSALSYARLTVDARAVIREAAALGRAVGRATVTPIDLATALALYDAGNVARVWTAPSVSPPDPAAPIEDASATLAGPAERVLTAAAAIARQAGSAPVGTEHLLVALIRDGHPEVVTILAERGGTAEAADALLADLAGRPGVETTPVPVPEPRRPRVSPRRVIIGLTAAVVIVLIVLACLVAQVRLG